ncbi:cupredoxin domain-containing protein [Chitinasiproducens palmae]
MSVLFKMSRRPAAAGFLAARAAALFASLLAVAVVTSAHAADVVTVNLELGDGKLSPARIEVPAGQRIKVVLKNTGKSAAEFESLQLRKEKVLAPGVESYVIIAPLKAGEYKFFDDFHQTAQGVIVAK